jgi:hypothetical protein
VPEGPAADRFIEDARKQAEPVDANGILYSLRSSADYDPQPGLASIKTKFPRLGDVLWPPDLGAPGRWAQHVTQLMRDLDDLRPGPARIKEDFDMAMRILIVGAMRSAVLGGGLPRPGAT